MTKSELIKLVTQLVEQGAVRNEIIKAIDTLQVINTRRGDGLFIEVFGTNPTIGDEVTLKQVYDRARTCVDAKVIYRWRKKGYMVERVDAGKLSLDTTYVYKGFDAAKAEEYYASQKAKRDAKAKNK